MQLATGTIIDGKVVLEGATLPEGTVVTVLARDSDETFELPPELEAELAASIAEADRGETVTAAELSARVKVVVASVMQPSAVFLRPGGPWQPRSRVPG